MSAKKITKISEIRGVVDLILDSQHPIYVHKVSVGMYVNINTLNAFVKQVYKYT